MKIAIIGAGPRGILVTSQLINQFKHNTTQIEPLEISIFDPYGIGGRVWKANQWPGLIMNTPADQITLFTDQSVQLSSPVFDGPSLFEWSKSKPANDFLVDHHYHSDTIRDAKNLRTNDYPPRVLFGAYIQWFYEQLLAELPFNVKINFHETMVYDLIVNADNSIKLVTESDNFIFDKVVMSLGQQSNYLNQEEQQLISFSQDHNLSYIPPITPGDADLSKIPANENVIIRGLGLSFFDYVSELTIGRGGKFMRMDGQRLVYQPSGKEPHILAGSKRGLPYYPKAISQKGYGERFTPIFLTAENIQQSLVNKKLPFDKFIFLLRSDIELMYYSLVISEKYPNKSVSEFKAEFITTDNRQELLNRFGISNQDTFIWDLVLDPTINFNHEDFVQYQNDLINWLDQTTSDANMGSKTGPLTSSLELLRDFRDIIRNLVNQNMFTNNEYYHEFLNQFNSNNNFLAVGAPALRTSQLSALIRAGIVTIMGPNLEINPKNGEFFVSSKKFPQDEFKASTLVEARVPKADINHTHNPLLENLLENQLIQPATIDINNESVSILAVDVERKTDQVISPQSTLENIFIWGLTLEGIRWSTTTSPRPGVNDPNLQTADFIAAKLLNLPTIKSPELQ